MYGYTQSRHNATRNRTNTPTVKEFTKFFENEGFVVEDGKWNIEITKNGTTTVFLKDEEGYQFNSGKDSNSRKMRKLDSMLKKTETYIRQSNTKQNMEDELRIIKTNVRKAFELCGVNFEEYSNTCGRRWVSGRGGSTGYYSDSITAMISLKNIPEYFDGYKKDVYNHDSFTMSFSRDGNQAYNLSTRNPKNFTKMAAFLETFEKHYMVCSI